MFMEIQSSLKRKVITSNEELRDVAIKAGVFELNGKKMMVGIFRDVTVQKAESERFDFSVRVFVFQHGENSSFK